MGSGTRAWTIPWHRLASALRSVPLAIGITAAPGAIDGGGNEATDNVGPVQCSGPITCD